MTAEAIVQRVAGARRNNRGWLAKCPAHEDRAPSLSISSGTSGRVLLKCFAGCDIARVVAALGLELRDLFERDNSNVLSPQRARRAPSAAEIRDELQREAKLFREHHGITETELLLSSEVNQIRLRVGTRLGITLHAVPRKLWEGSYGGRERDRLWRVAFERAWHELWFERGMQPPYTLEEHAKDGRDMRPATRALVEDRAAQLFGFLVRAEAAYGRGA